MATETYYRGDYTRKNDHLKALKLALVAFDLRCTYVKFLLKILHDHFGEYLMAIGEEKSIFGENS